MTARTSSSPRNDRKAGIDVLPVTGFLCAVVGASAIFLLFYFHDNVGLIYTTETAVYLVGMFVLGAVWWAVARSIRRGQLWSALTSRAVASLTSSATSFR